MMLIRRAATAALVLAITAAGCSGNGASAPQPQGIGQPASGAATLGATTNPTEALPSGGDAGIVTYPAGSGTISVTDSTSAPAGVTALTSIARTPASTTVSVKDDTAGPQTPLLYLTYTAQTAVTLAGVPGVSVTLAAAPPSGGVYEAIYSAASGTWYAVGPPAGVNGASVTLPIATPYPASLAAGASIYVAIYSGTKLAASPSPVPTPSASPTPKPATPTPTASPSASPTPSGTPMPTATPVGASPTPTPNAIADAGFESGNAAAYGSAITSTGWTQCVSPAINSSTTLNPVVAGPNSTTSATPHPVSSYTPEPMTTPLAFIEATGYALPQPSSPNSPAPTEMSFFANSGTYGALFGLFSSTPTNYVAEDYHYDGLCQTITVPAGASTMSFYVLGTNNETITKYAFDAILLNADNSWASWLYDENSASDTAYRQVTIPMPQGVAGGSYTLFLGNWANGSGSAYTSGYYFLDDVSLVPGVAGASKRRAPMTVPSVRKK